MVVAERFLINYQELEHIQSWRVLNIVLTTTSYKNVVADIYFRMVRNINLKWQQSKKECFIYRYNYKNLVGHVLYATMS